MIRLDMFMGCNHMCVQAFTVALSGIAKETQMYRTVFWTLWERARVG